MDWLFGRTDRVTLLLLSLLAGISVIAVYSATHSKEPLFWGSGGRQLVYALAGVLLYVIVSKIDYHDWSDLAFLLYWIGIAALGLVLLMRPIAGARAWFDLGPIRLQPSEPMKALCVLACATYLARSPARLSFTRLIRLALIVALPVGLILLQPDMGSALTFLPLLLGCAWIAGLRPRVFVVLAVLAALAAPIGWFTVLKPYQKERIITVLDPDRDPMGKGYQTRQSRIAVGSGEIVGKGLFRGSQSRLEFLPARETDFILAVIAEERGFVGVLLVLGLQLALLLRALKTALTAQDYLGSLIAVGVVSVTAGQLFINTGMVSGVLPTIGVPLPAVSYGGSSMLATFLGFGLVSSVHAGRLVNA